MTKIKFPALAILFILCSAFVSPKATIYDYQVKDIIGNNISLSKYEGKVLLIVNVASKCGLTPQYEDLQTIYDKYQECDLVVMGFPANNFLGQEPASNEEINRFCTQKFGVTFPMFSKISVKGKNMHPLYQYLTQKEKNHVINAPIKWNFQKFLINRQGTIVKSFAPAERITSKKVEAAIQHELMKGKEGKKLKKLLKVMNEKQKNS